MKIAITQRLDKTIELRSGLDIRWFDLFKKLDFIPIILPYNYNFRKYKFDGVILSGGNDIGEYNFRDKFEFDLIDYCIKLSIPIFGVCRGMQIISRYFSSTLKKVSNQVNIKHSLIINQNSKYAKFLKKINQVNSFHNYTIDRLSDEFIISAWNNDKTIIKAIEHKKYKIFAQMWHTERDSPFDKNQLFLIKEFFK